MNLKTVHISPICTCNSLAICLIVGVAKIFVNEAFLNTGLSNISSGIIVGAKSEKFRL